jgi:hypothetical protein
MAVSFQLVVGRADPDRLAMRDPEGNEFDIN